MSALDIEQQEHLAILRSMQKDVGENLGFLGTVEKNWQPSDYLPDLAGEDWREQVQGFRDQAQGLTDDLLVILVGDMVTEEALPSYAIQLNLIAEDHEGASDRPWSKWLRGWTAEENRHGDLLNGYLRLTGRVDMRSVELTINHLLAKGFDPETHPDPYNGLIYTSFQERATKISHKNVAHMCRSQGDANLARICAKIAGDESRHEAFYTRMMGKVMELDPAGGILAFRHMIRSLIAMPGRLMYDGQDPDLFDHFAVVAQRASVYTVHDYATILDHLVKTWNIAAHVVSGKAAKAQDYLCRQAERYHSLADAVTEHMQDEPVRKFAWIHNRTA